MKGKSPRDIVIKTFELCYGVAKDTKSRSIVVPIVVKKQNDKAVLHGVDREGVLIGPCKDGKELLKKLEIQSWLQGNTLTPVKDRPTFWQRSLISAVFGDNEDDLRYSFFCQESYRGQPAKIHDSLKPSLKAARELLKLYMKQNMKDLVSSSKAKTKKRKLTGEYTPFTTTEALSTLLLSEREYREHAKRCPERMGLCAGGKRTNCNGCATSLADLHRACRDQTCKGDETFCMDCPDIVCSVCEEPFDVYDYSIAKKTKELHEYAKASLSFCDTQHSAAVQSAEREQSALQEAFSTLPDECRMDGYLCVSAQQFTQSRVAQNALQQGLPVLIKGVGSHFDSSPFTVEALLEVAKLQNEMADNSDVEEPHAYVQMQLSAEEKLEADLSLLSFFEPLRSLAESTCDPIQEGREATGYVVADLGIQPERQGEALYKACDALGIGSLVRPDGRSNLYSYLQSGADNPEHGTRKPDLGAKLYVARPRVRREKGQNVYHGTTNTRLHCDLSDAVNYNSGEGDAIWTMFAAAERTKLQTVLDGKGRDLFFVSEATFLTSDVLAAMKIPYAQFTQKKGDLVLIPAGCAHQVENCSPLPTVKVAQDFVAAESTARCWEMMQEMKRVKALDVLQLRLTLRFAAAWLYEELGEPQSTKRKQPQQPRSPPEVVASPALPITQLPDSEDPRADVQQQPLSEASPVPGWMNTNTREPAGPRKAEIESSGTEIVPYTPQDQVVASVDTALAKSTGLHAGYSDQVKNRATRVQMLCMAAEDEVQQLEDSKKAASAKLSETQRALDEAKMANDAAQKSLGAASDRVKKAREVLRARIGEREEISKEIEVGKAEAKKFLEIFS